MGVLNQLKKPAEGAPAATTKEEFVGKTGAPKRPSGKGKPAFRSLADDDDIYLKILLFGDFGTGKTHALNDLLEMGYKALVITTDVGGDGLNTVRAYARKTNQPHLLKQVRHAVLETFEDVEGFLTNPAEYMADIYEWDPDIIFWDGYSGFQQYQLSEHAEDEMIVKGITDRQQYWGIVRNESVRLLNKFLYMNNKATGKVWNKIMTCLETMSLADEKAATLSNEAKRTAAKDVKQFFVQGSAAKLIGPAFDLILYCHKGVKRNDAGEKVDVFHYKTQQSLTMKVKKRGVELPPVVEGGMGEVWRMACEQLGIALPAPKEEAA